ncbi:MAG: hypothetical protein BMS9Abin36_1430 [Gammaproteobacteria bacterium]|nr:MAG: hypothetical protein BMS9Abin36_1430 [Gammaproteobacteria bacterium]
MTCARIFLLLFVTVLAACSSLPTSQDRKALAQENIKPAARSDFSRAVKALKARKHKTAERLLISMTRKYPELSGPYLNLGILYSRTSRYRKAETWLRKAIKVNPRKAAAYNELGILLRNQGKFKQAREAYEQALSVDPDYAYAHLNLGILFDLYLLQSKDALSHYRRYQNQRPGDKKQVSKWIIDLERRIKRGDKVALY